MAVTDAGTGAPTVPCSSGRGVELLLLVAAAGLVTVALVIVEAAAGRTLTGQVVWLGGGYLGLFVIAQGALRRWTPHADPLLLPIAAVLNGLGRS